MSTSIRINANVSSFQEGMKQVKQTMKDIQTEYSLTSQKAKLLGDSQGELKAKTEQLSGRIEAQKEKIRLNSERAVKLTEDLEKLRTKENELKDKITQAEQALKDSQEATGKNSEESKKLKEELNKLKSEYETTEKKLETTTTKLSDTKKATEYANRELSNMQTELEKTQEKLSAVKIEEFGSNMEKAGQKIESVGKVMTGATTVITGVATASVNTASDFEAQMSRVQAISGATGDAFGALEKQAIELGAGTAFSALEAAQGMENLASAGFTTTEIMAAMPGMLDLAASSGEDLANSADIAASTLRGFGLEAEEAGHVADVLAKNAADTNAAVADTGEAMKYVAPVAKAMGISFEETAAAVGIMADQGIKGSQAGTSLRGALSRLTKPTDAMCGVMGELGLAFFDNEGKMISLTAMTAMLQEKTKNLSDEERNSALVTLFGQNALSGMLALVQTGPEKLSTLTSNYENCDEAAKTMAETMQNNLKGQMESLGGTMESISIAIGQALTPNIKATVGTMEEWAGKFLALDKEQQKNIITTAGVVAAIGPAVLAFGKITSAVGGAMTKFGTMKSSVIAAGKTLSALPLGPIAGVVAGIGILVAAIMHLWQNNEDFRNKVTATWEQIKQTFQNFVAELKKRLDSLGINFDDISKRIRDTIAWLKETASKIWTEFCDFIGPVATGAFSLAADIISGILDTILDTIDMFIAFFKGDWESCWNSGEEIVTRVFNAIVDIVSSLLKNASEAVRSGLSAIGDMFFNLVLELPSIGADALNVVTNLVIGFTEKIVSLVNFLVLKIPEIKVSDVLNAAKKAVSNAADAIKGYFTSLKPSLPQVSTSDALSKFKKSVSDALDSLKKNFENLKPKLNSIGTGSLDTLKNVASKALKSVKDGFNLKLNLPTIGTGALDTLKKTIKALKLVLPKITGGGISLPSLTVKGKFSINPLSIPTFAVKWNATGGIMTRPTLFGSIGNTLLGGGEAGAEAILPLSGFYSYLTDLLDRKIEKMARASTTVINHFYVDGEEVTARTYTKVIEKLGEDYKSRR